MMPLAKAAGFFAPYLNSFLSKAKVTNPNNAYNDGRARLPSCRPPVYPRHVQPGFSPLPCAPFPPCLRSILYLPSILREREHGAHVYSVRQTRNNYRFSHRFYRLYSLLFFRSCPLDLRNLAASSTSRTTLPARDRSCMESRSRVYLPSM